MDLIYPDNDKLGTGLGEVRRWYAKANAFASGWRLELSSDPPLSAVVLGLAVAQLETACGDVWPGVHNWGAVQSRVPSTLERKVLVDAGVPPSPANAALGQAALARAIEEGVIPPNPTGSLQCDSSPTSGYYWVFFQAFPDDAAGATRFVHVLAVSRPQCRTVLMTPGASEAELAAAMYASGYYEGTHDPSTQEGKQANIAAYASAIRSWTPRIRAVLGTWTPGANPPSIMPAPDPKSDLWVQWALNKVGVVPPLTEDGVLGPKSKSAIAAFQQGHNLKVDGVAGPLTRAALAKELP